MMRPNLGLALRRGVKICIWNFEPMVKVAQTQAMARSCWPNDLAQLYPVMEHWANNFGAYNRKYANVFKRKFKITSGDSFDLVNFDD